MQAVGISCNPILPSASDLNQNLESSNQDEESYLNSRMRKVSRQYNISKGKKVSNLSTSPTALPQTASHIQSQDLTSVLNQGQNVGYQTSTAISGSKSVNRSGKQLNLKILGKKEENLLFKHQITVQPDETATEGILSPHNPKSVDTKQNTEESFRGV